MSGSNQKPQGSNRAGTSKTFGGKKSTDPSKLSNTSAAGPSKPSTSRPDVKYSVPNVPDGVRKRLASVLDDDDDDDLFKYVKMKDPPEEKLYKDMFRLPPPFEKKLNLMEKKFYDKGRRFLINLKQKNVPKPPAQVGT